jgi:hypothetical protein
VAWRRQYMVSLLLSIGTIWIIILHYISPSIDYFVYYYMGLICVLCTIIFIFLAILLSWKQDS